MSANFKEVQNNTHAKWWKDPGLRKSCLQVLVLYFCNYSLGYDGSLLSGLQGLSQWNEFFGNPTGTRLGLIAATYYLPKIITVFIVAWMADKYGRKSILLLGGLFMLAGAIVGGTSVNLGQLIGSRILLGIGTAAAAVGAISLIPELAHPRLRHMSGSFLNTVYYVGSILAAWLCFAFVFYNGSDRTVAWRVPTYVQGLGPVLLLIGLPFVDESPRWQLSKGQEEKAHRTLAKLHANGQMDDPLVLLELREIKASLALEAATNKTSWLVWFQNRSNLLRFFVIIIIGTATQWMGNGVVQYYLVPVLRTVGVTAPAQTTGINGGLAIFNWGCALTGAYFVERFGRRPLFLTSLTGCLVCFIIITGLSGAYNTTKNTNTGIAVIPFIYLFMGSYSMALTPLPMLYIAEIVPTSMRTKAVALFTLSQNVSQAFNQFVNPIALAEIGWKYYIVYCAVIATYIFLFWRFVRETRGLTVEEAAAVYDPEDVRARRIEEEQRLKKEALEKVYHGPESDSKEDFSNKV